MSLRLDMSTLSIQIMDVEMVNHYYFYVTLYHSCISHALYASCSQSQHTYVHLFSVDSLDIGIGLYCTRTCVNIVVNKPAMSLNMVPNDFSVRDSTCQSRITVNVQRQG
jgi:hypothetical protein